MSLAAIAMGAGLVVLALSMCGAIYAAGAALALARFARRPRLELTAAPDVTVMRPMSGEEPGLYDNLLSLCRQDYPGAVQIVLGVQNPADPALAVAQRLQHEHPDRDIRVVCDPTLHGSNRKIGNLINMSAQASGQVIVISDSDVRLPADGLLSIVATLKQPGVGLAHCLYRGRPAAGLWSRIAALDSNARFMPSVAVGEALGANPCMGPTMALRADLLQSIGGFALLADVLADDFVLGAAVRAAGQTLASPPLVIDHLFPENSLGEVWSHELRWARTIRLVQPAGYAGSLIVHFLPLAMIGAAMTGFAGWSLLLLAALAVWRWTLGVVLCRLLKADMGALWLLPLRDVLSLAVFAAGLVGDSVRWRGRRLRVERDGAMAPS